MFRAQSVCALRDDSALMENQLKRKYRTARQAEGLAADFHEDDGVDPRRLSSRVTRRDADMDHKSLQMCKEAARALSISLQCDCSDPVLQCLEVVSVTPAGNANRLRVVVRPAGETIGALPDDILARLAAITGFLRARIAASITRRRVAELSFVVAPPIGGGS